MTQGGKQPPDAFPPELLAPLEALAASGPVRVALSGGLDSIVLLHLACHVFARRPEILSAIHVNHQLQPDASHFESRCRQICEQLGVPLEVVRVRVDDSPGSIETRARDARYRVFSERLVPGEVLLMAHHQDDQEETLLFRFLRGSGVRGLGGMPAERTLGRGRLVRPWLQVPRRLLRQQALSACWSWVEDPTNADDGFDRNFLRHRILPVLRERWPQLDRRLLATARACRESAELADLLAESHYQQLEAGRDRLSLSGVRALPLVACRNLLQWWLGDSLDRSLGDSEIRDLLDSSDDASPEILAGEFALRRFQDHIYRVPRVRAPLVGDQPLLANEWVTDGDYCLCLRCHGDIDKVPQLRLGHRRGGERLRPGPEGQSRPLKKWLQEQQVPPWERNRLPLVFQGNGELVAIADLWSAPDVAGDEPENGWWLDIRQQ
ncbi:tRNA lysidine(34) synthetase TilS [Marinobacter zhanjiangensis]|uniref:tRNA(Ile)-lysidine synthase n=1 Tax=Marinobacter zhanjiangensis TaxID=578215 RepID=A0ABQ3ASU7_9GAMM|nr:tRNA lysidine(34) synthetase TilS [Marinobacter zhanjiangensis]GGY64904.1 tRNA(Ile)-lysidine synthase [Marinobacter zhanjiangensis]